YRLRVSEKEKKGFLLFIFLRAGLFVRLFFCIPARGCLSRDKVRDTSGNDDHHDSNDDQGDRWDRGGSFLCHGQLRSGGCVTGIARKCCLVGGYRVLVIPQFLQGVTLVDQGGDKVRAAGSPLVTRVFRLEKISEFVLGIPLVFKGFLTPGL